MSQLTLTLHLNDELVKAAQEYARQHGQSLETLVAELLQTTIQPVVPAELKLSPIVRELYGCLKLPKDFDYREEMEKALLEKYGI